MSFDLCNHARDNELPYSGILQAGILHVHFFRTWRKRGQNPNRYRAAHHSQLKEYQEVPDSDHQYKFFHHYDASEFLTRRALFCHPTRLLFF